MLLDSQDQEIFQKKKLLSQIHQSFKDSQHIRTNMFPTRKTPKKYLNKYKKAPIFITKLHEIVQNQQYNDLINWTSSFDSFSINRKKLSEFTTIILPKYYKHCNYESFVRQLNMYNFVKVKHRLIGTNNLEDYEVFQNEHFKKGNHQHFKHIRRKINNKNCQEEVSKENQKSIQLNYELMDSKYLSIVENISINNATKRKQTQNFHQNQNHRSKIQQQVEYLKQQHDQLQQQCFGLLRQNQIIMSQNNSLFRKIHNDSQQREKILEEIIKFMAINEDTEEDMNTILPKKNKKSIKIPLLNSQILEQLNLKDLFGSNKSQLFSSIISFIEKAEMKTIMQTLSKFCTPQIQNEGNYSQFANFLTKNYSKEIKGQQIFDINNEIMLANQDIFLDENNFNFPFTN